MGAALGAVLAALAAPAAAQPLSASQGATAAPAERAEEAALAAIRARALIGLDRPAEARREIEAALAANPDDPAALRALGALEEHAGRWRQAAAAWDRLHALTGDAPAKARRDALRRTYPSALTATALFEGAPGDDEQRGLRLAAALRPLDGPEWSLSLEARSAEIDAATRLDGRVGPLSAEALRFDAAIADELRFARVAARVTASGQGIGGGLSATRRRGAWTGTLSAGVDEPYWLYSVGLENEADIDHVGLGGRFDRPRLGARFEVRAQDYGVADSASVARSVRTTAGLDLAAAAAPDAWRLAYVLDAESFADEERRAGPGGTRFTPLPFVDREVHSFGLYKSPAASAERRPLTLGAGYRIDRRGAEGPFAGLNAELRLTPQVRLGLRSEYSEVSVRGDADQSYAFAELSLVRLLQVP